MMTAVARAVRFDRYGGRDVLVRFVNRRDIIAGAR